MKDCPTEVTESPNKVNKNLERSVVEGFSYSDMRTGIFIGSAEGCVVYPMPTIDILGQHHYDWARSAQVI